MTMKSEPTIARELDGYQLRRRRPDAAGVHTVFTFQAEGADPIDIRIPRKTIDRLNPREPEAHLERIIRAELRAIVARARPVKVRFVPSAISKELALQLTWTTDNAVHVIETMPADEHRGPAKVEALADALLAMKQLTPRPDDAEAFRAEIVGALLRVYGA